MPGLIHAPNNGSVDYKKNTGHQIGLPKSHLKSTFLGSFVTTYERLNIFEGN